MPEIHLPQTPEQRQEWPFMLGDSNYIGDAAVEMSIWMNDAFRPVYFSWNGTPFDGYPGDTPNDILERYWQTRTLWQAAIKQGWEAPRYDRPGV